MPRNAAFTRARRVLNATLMLRPLLLAVVTVAASACTRSLPKYERPIARAQFQTVRTTAYTHTESDHIEHGRKTCLGTHLRCGAVKSAAADWSRWPAGTMFRILATGEVFEVDDIGWAISGRNTIDLYKPSREAMNRWGVRMVDIQILRWGDDSQSLAVLRKRCKYAHCRRMSDDLEKRIARGETNPEVSAIAAAVMVPESGGGLRRKGP